jgi:hypothetical protein
VGIVNSPDEMHALAAEAGCQWYHAYHIKSMAITESSGRERAAGVGYIRRLGEHGARGLNKAIQKRIASQVITVGRTRPAAAL